MHRANADPNFIHKIVCSNAVAFLLMAKYIHKTADTREIAGWTKLTRSFQKKFMFEQIRKNKFNEIVF